MRVVLDSGMPRSNPEGAQIAGEIARGVVETLSRAGHVAIALDAFVPISARVEVAGSLRADAYLSIQVRSDTRGSHGAGIYTNTDPLGASLFDSFSNVPFWRSQSSDSSLYLITRQPERAVAVLHCGYITHWHDSQVLRSADGRLSIAQAIAKGFLVWAS
jgi:N-acetylmuramoyl-L-alanine amidase